MEMGLPALVALLDHRARACAPPCDLAAISIIPAAFIAPEPSELNPLTCACGFQDLESCS